MTCDRRGDLVLPRARQHTNCDRRRSDHRPSLPPASDRQSGVHPPVRRRLVTPRLACCPAAGEALAAAFVDDPLCVYIQPDVDARLSQFSWFFAQLVRDGVEHGGAYCHNSLGRTDGVAVWQPPQAADPTPNLEELKKRFGLEPYQRFVAYRHLERVRSQAMADRPHWHLSVLGVRPDS